MQQASSLLLEKTLKAPSGGLLLGLCAIAAVTLEVTLEWSHVSHRHCCFC